ncbi:hypothetical protein [Hathewaya limosa]|uniref:Uncharacterized protein YceK n=1 Tax=Hathewaya limosa TaxID=1536 RepID=A0ABU0JWP4_HATLI|nr:hypothetical protein [Hathewaya limosa]MDQ0480342.1 uncharacterized protein YceK [Hathewaya limosa]
MTWKKISLIITVIFSIYLVGCSSIQEKTSLNDNNKNQNIMKSKDSTDNKVNNKNSKESTSTIQKSESNIVENSKNKQVDKVKPQKNSIKENEINKKNYSLEIGMSVETVKNILKKNNIEIQNEIEVTTTPSDPSFGNRQLWTKNMTLEFDKNTNKLCSIEKYPQ